LSRNLHARKQQVQKYKQDSLKFTAKKKIAQDGLERSAKQLELLKGQVAQDLAIVGTLASEKSRLTLQNRRLRGEMGTLTSLVSKLNYHITTLASILQSQEGFNTPLPPVPTMAECTSEREQRK
jgi:hypothetical protein